MENDHPVSIVLPMFNEKESIGAAIRNAAGFLSSRYAGSEIIVIDDGSTDGSFEVVEQLKKEFSSLKCIHFDKNKGIGRALRTALGEAKNSIILYTDSDWPVSNDVLKEAFDLLNRENADLVVGYRKGKRELFYRKVYSFLYNFFVRVVFGLGFKDTNCPLKLIRKKVIDNIILRSDGPFIDAELLVRSRNKGYKIVELVYLNIPRKSGHSKFNSFSGVIKAMSSTLIEMSKLAPELLSGGLKGVK